MIRIISDKKAESLIAKQEDWIAAVSRKYQIPSALIKAVLFTEMTMIDIADVAVDFIVWTGLFPKKDSSTGYAQIFSYVGINAVNFACDQGITDYQKLGIKERHRLNAGNPKDLRWMWKHLHADRQANIEIASLNLLSAAKEVNGSMDFSAFGDEEIKKVLSRYNADTRQITAYGEKAFICYQKYLNE